MKFSLLVVSLACAGVACAGTYYATSNPTYDPATGAEVATAAKTAAGEDVEAWSLTNCIAKAKSATSYAAGDKILLLKGVYDYSGPKDSDAQKSRIIANKPYLTICGETGDRKDVVFKGNPDVSCRCFQLDKTTCLHSLTITNFVSTSSGGGIWINGYQYYCVVSNALIVSCRASNGGGVHGGFETGSTWVNWAKLVRVVDSEIADCHYTQSANAVGTGGGGVFSAVCIHTTFRGDGPAEGASTGNLVTGGAACSCDSTNCTFIGCLGYYGGICGASGGSYATRSTGCVFIGNTVPGGDGGSLCRGTARNCKFINNTAAYSVTQAAENCIFISNTCHYVAFGSAKNSLFCFNDCAYQNSNNDGINYGPVINCTIVSNISSKLVFGPSKTRCVNVFVAGNVKTRGGTVKTPLGNGLQSTTNIVTDVISANDGTSPFNWVKDANALSYVKWGADGIPCGIVRSAASRRTLIDQGFDVGWTAADEDVLGNPRIFNGVVDIGCFEWPGPIPGLLLMVR